MRFWRRMIGEEDLAGERAWLLQNIYTGYGEPAFLPQSAGERYR